MGEFWGDTYLVSKQQDSRKSAKLDVRSTIDSQISTLSDLSVSDLRKLWKSHFATEAPTVRSGAILCRLIAWQLQAEASEGLDSASERALNKIGQAMDRDGLYEPKIRSGFSPGVILSREWKGVIHRVTAADNGFDYLGKRYRSLSEIARAITGTRWSGPRFFGLEQKTAPASRAAAR